MSARAACVLLHRWLGLATAGFLIVVGLTGSLLAFFPELNHALAPRLYPGPHPGIELDAATLARRAEALVPFAEATTVYLGNIGTAQIGMRARAGAPALDFSILYLDVVTGEELGRLQWGALPATLDGIVPFVYNLHYRLAAGEVGEWILGVVALAWTLDCFVAFCLTLPTSGRRSAKSFLARWKPAWLVKFGSSAYRVSFDLHRANGLWLWVLLLIFAWSSVYWNLEGVYSTVTGFFLDYERSATFSSQPSRVDAGREPLRWEEAQSIARRLMDEQSRERGFSVERPLALYIDKDSGLVEYRVRSSRDIGDKGGATSIHFDAYSGALRSVRVPTGQHAGNTLTTWLAALHMANLFGLPYKIAVCGLGLAIAMLSVTGVYIWWMKQRARVAGAKRRTAGSVDA
jgi:uncharacterized iron-regulated membrane protein